ncbi:MAG: MerR family transcriptional regulator [Polyangiaceae bacterium]
MTNAPNAPETTELTIDELAAVAKVPSRTVRFYQSKGALMPPEIRGRVAYYGKAHVERLKLIAQLQDRGLRIDAIRDLLASIDKGEIALAEWLGVEQEVQASWANDQPKTMTEAELYQVTGSSRPGLIADLVRAKLVQRHADVFLVRSPALLSIAMKLEAAGVDMETAQLAAATLQKHMSRAAADLLELFFDKAKEGAINADDAGQLLQALRPTALESVRVIFGREMERALRALFESGRLAQLPARVKRRRRSST